MLTFYTTPFSSNAQKVHFFLEAHQIPYTPRRVNLSLGEQQAPDYLRINPFGVVPAIDLGGMHLSESNTILRFLARRFDKTAAYPRADADAARVDELMDFVTLHIARFIGAVNFQVVVAPTIGGKTNQGVIDDAHMNLSLQVPKLERHLTSSGTYLCGNELTIADAAFVPALAQAPRLGIDLSGSPQVAAYQRRLLTHPAWQVVAAEFAAAMAAFKPK